MDYEEEVREKLGSGNVGIVIDKIRRGSLLKGDVIAMAREMHPNVFDNLVQNHEIDNRPDFIFLFTLDYWYNHCLRKITDEEAKREFVNIVQKVENQR